MKNDLIGKVTLTAQEYADLAGMKLRTAQMHAEKGIVTAKKNGKEWIIYLNEDHDLFKEKKDSEEKQAPLIESEPLDSHDEDLHKTSFRGSEGFQQNRNRTFDLDETVKDQAESNRLLTQENKALRDMSENIKGKIDLVIKDNQMLAVQYEEKVMALQKEFNEKNILAAEKQNKFARKTTTIIICLFTLVLASTIGVVTYIQENAKKDISSANKRVGEIADQKDAIVAEYRDELKALNEKTRELMIQENKEKEKLIEEKANAQSRLIVFENTAQQLAQEKELLQKHVNELNSKIIDLEKTLPLSSPLDQEDLAETSPLSASSTNTIPENPSIIVSGNSEVLE